MTGSRIVKTSVHIPEDLYLLARHLGLKNLNEFVINSLQGFVDGQEDPVADTVAHRARSIAIELRKKSMEQRKITSRTEEEIAEITRLQEQRRARIRAAIDKEILRTGEDRFRRYILDLNGDYAQIQDDMLAAISRDCGIAVELSDVLTVTGWRLTV